MRKSGTVLALTAVAAVFLCAGLALIVLGVFLALQAATNPPTAALVCGLLSLIFAGAIAWSIQRFHP